MDTSEELFEVFAVFYFCFRVFFGFTGVAIFFSLFW